MKKFFQSYFSLIFIVIAVSLTLIPLLKPGLPDVHDPTSAFRLATLVNTIKDGQFPAAWNNSLNYGFGYPLHLYYAPLFSYFSALVYSVFRNHEVAIKVTLALISLFGSYGVYLNVFSKGRAIALLATIAFTFLPYRASAIYVRGSYAEFLAMSILPWLVYLWSKPLNSKYRLVTTTLITSAFILSHNTLFILLPPILILLIYIYQKDYLKNAIVVLILSIGISSWSLFPVVFERNLVQAQAIALQTNFQDHFVTLRQLWFSAWGYGGSSPGESNDLMSFMLGKGQIILAVISTIYLLYKKNYQLLVVPFALTIFYLFFTQSFSTPLWQLMPIMGFLQFPWRLLSYATVGLSMLAGYSLLAIPSRFRNILLIIVIFLLINTNHRYFNPWNTLNYSDSILSDQNNLNNLVSQKIPEYLPVAMPTFPTSSLSDGLSRTATSVRGNLTITGSMPIVISTAYMPQWQLQLNKVITPITSTPEGLIQTTQSQLPNTYQIDLTWHRSIIEKLGLIITVLSILVMIGLWVL